jgi:hypothetical protein
VLGGIPEITESIINAEFMDDCGINEAFNEIME